MGMVSQFQKDIRDLVCQELLIQPKMQRQHESFTNIKLCNEVDRSITDTLSEENKEYMVGHIIIRIAPLLLGDGIPLFAQEETLKYFHLDTVKSLDTPLS